MELQNNNMNNLDTRYQALLQDILDNGVEKKDRTGTGTLSVFGRQIRHKMSEGFPILTTKKVAWKQVVSELLWFLTGQSNIAFLLKHNNHIWDGDAYKNYAAKTSMDVDGQLTKEEFIKEVKTNNEFAKKWGDLGPIYGKQWRSWKINLLSPETFNMVPPIDQIDNLINELKTNPDSRRLMVSAWNVGELEKMVLPPCHYGFQVYTRELDETERVVLMDKKLGVTENLPAYYTEDEMVKHNIPKRAISLMWNQRSVDTFLGLPFNIASYGLLLEIIAKSVNMIPDELIGNLGDVHLYSNHIEQAKEQIGREPYELPKLNINTEFWATESGSCGEGLIDAVSVFEAFKDENFCKCLLEEDIQLYDYQSHPSIKAPLSN
jgi:thymidylate synthase